MFKTFAIPPGLHQIIPRIPTAPAHEKDKSKRPGSPAIDVGKALANISDIASKLNDLSAFKSQRKAIRYVLKKLNEVLASLQKIEKQLASKKIELDPELKKQLETVKTKISDKITVVKSLKHDADMKVLVGVVSTVQSTILGAGAAAEMALSVAGVSVSALSMALPAAAIAIEVVGLVTDAIKESQLKDARAQNLQLATEATKKLDIADLPLEIQTKLKEINADLTALNEGKTKLSAKAKCKNRFELDAFLDKVDALKTLCISKGDATLFETLDTYIHQTLTCQLAAKNFKRQCSEIKSKRRFRVVGIATCVASVVCAATGFGSIASGALMLGFVLVKFGMGRYHAHRVKVTQAKADKCVISDKSTPRDLYKAALDHHSGALIQCALRSGRSTTDSLWVIGPDGKALTAVRLTIAEGTGTDPFDDRQKIKPGVTQDEDLQALAMGAMASVMQPQPAAPALLNRMPAPVGAYGACCKTPLENTKF